MIYKIRASPVFTCVEMLRTKSLSESGFAGFSDFQDYRCVFKTGAFHSFHSKTVNWICFSTGYKPLLRLGFRRFSSKVAMKAAMKISWVKGVQRGFSLFNVSENCFYRALSEL